MNFEAASELKFKTQRTAIAFLRNTSASTALMFSLALPAILGAAINAVVADGRGGWIVGGDFEPITQVIAGLHPECGGKAGPPTFPPFGDQPAGRQGGGITPGGAQAVPRAEAHHQRQEGQA